MRSNPALHKPQPWPVRFTHWVNLVLLPIMAGSGLQILVAFPHLGPRGAPYGWYPWQGGIPPAWTRIGGWLAGARHWHFAFGWLFVANGAFYLAYLVASGEWRRRFFLPRRDLRAALAMAAHYLRLRKTAPPQGLYNGLQRLAYTGVAITAGVAVWSGLALYKPVQLGWMTAAVGGYDAARAVHLGVLAALAAFTVMHLVLVALHPRTVAKMIGGGRPAPLTPEDGRAGPHPPLPT